jgi:hypothetical protein
MGQEITHVKFNINGTELEDPSGKFCVILVTNISALTYSSAGGYYGYDEYKGINVTGFPSGYGYANFPIFICYEITYTTHLEGTFYAKLFVNTSTYTYESPSSAFFTVLYSGGGGGYTSPSTPPSEKEERIEPSDTTLDVLNTHFDIALETPFYAIDTDKDGHIDSFNDPNDIIDLVDIVNITGNTAILLSSNQDDIPEMFWDPLTDTLTPITHSQGVITGEEINVKEEQVIITLEVNKSNWIWIEITDQYPPSAYPDIVLNIQNETGYPIPSERVWRKNGKIYVLDDPSTMYKLIYNIFFLAPIFEPSSGSIINTTTPIITITYYENVSIISATFGIIDILDQLYTSENTSFSFSLSSSNLTGTYVLHITAQDAENHTLSSSATYHFPERDDTIPDEKRENGEFPWIIIIVGVVISCIMIIILLFKTGYLYLE